MKRILTLVLCLAMLMSMTAFAGETIFGIEQIKKFRVLGSIAVTGYPENDEDNLCIKTFKERTGVEYTVEAYNGDDYITKLQLYIASGNMIGSLPLAEKEDAKYGGWWYGDIRLDNDTVLNITEHITVTFIWNDGNTVYFYTDGGECEETTRFVKKVKL